MKVMVIGSGAREHALVERFALENETENTFAAPGNAGIAQYATCIPVDGTIRDYRNAAEKYGIDLTVVGPEAPIVEGIANVFQESGLRAFAPSMIAARAEGSKIWFKKRLKEYNVPTAPFMVFQEPTSAYCEIKRRSPHACVVKEDGLKGGKGVHMLESLSQAYNVVHALLKPSGKSNPILIEERLDGVEYSVTVLTDGKSIRVLPFTQDYKRLRTGGQGPNTGGMGAHTVHLPQEKERQLALLAKQILHGLASDGITYAGVMYLGIMWTKNGPFVLECNARFGDPETSVMLPTMGGSLTAYCNAVIDGTLRETPPIKRLSREACAVVLASKEYPEKSQQNAVIDGLDEAHTAGGRVHHGNTALGAYGISTNYATRVLTCVGVGETLPNARAIAYDAAGHITFDGEPPQFRSDIGTGIHLATCYDEQEHTTASA